MSCPNAEPTGLAEAPRQEDFTSHLDTLTDRNDHCGGSASIEIEPCLRKPRTYDLKNRLSYAG